MPPTESTADSHEQVPLTHLARDLRRLKPHGWSVVLGNGEVIVRPTDRRLGKFRVIRAPTHIGVSFFSRPLNQWNKRAYFTHGPTVTTEVRDWMVAEALEPTRYVYLPPPWKSRGWATLRLFMDSLIPEEVTARLGVEPSEWHRRGESVQYSYGEELEWRGRPWRSSSWRLCSERHVPTTDTALELHIAWLLDQLGAAQAEGKFLALHQEDVQADVFCFWEARGNAGLTLSAEVMGRLAALDLTLGLDIYGLDGDAEE